MRVDLNADAGESFGAWTLGADEQLFQIVSSVNLACGFHAGDPSVIRRALRAAGRAGVAIGAHPSYPDLAGFGRRPMRLDAPTIEDLVMYQVAALAGMARAEGLRVGHVKPHGALYNDAAVDPLTARAIARAVRLTDASLALVGLAGSALVAAARAEGLRALEEAFADRGYERDGTLTPRGTPGAVIDNPAIAAARAVSIVRDHCVAAAGGEPIGLHADTICIHGDTIGAPVLARAVRDALEHAGVQVAAPFT
jgi:UPF0271 protein